MKDQIWTQAGTTGTGPKSTSTRPRASKSKPETGRFNARGRDRRAYVSSIDWLTRTDPIPDSQSEPAQILGQRRFEFFVDQVMDKVATEASLARRTMDIRQSIADNA